MATVPCLCPTKASGEVRHPDGDTITLREKLDFRGALSARNAVAIAQSDGAGIAEILADLTETYLVLGIESWSLTDAKGKPLPVSREAIAEHLLTNIDVAMQVADEADALYREAVLAPLRARALSSSPPTSTDESTSATNGSAPKPPKPSRRSSTTTSPTGGTGTTSLSPVGVSN